MTLRDEAIEKRSRAIFERHRDCQPKLVSYTLAMAEVTCIAEHLATLVLQSREQHGVTIDEVFELLGTEQSEDPQARADTEERRRWLAMLVRTLGGQPESESGRVPIAVRARAMLDAKQAQLDAAASELVRLGAEISALKASRLESIDALDAAHGERMELIKAKAEIAQLHKDNDALADAAASMESERDLARDMVEHAHADLLALRGQLADAREETEHVRKELTVIRAKAGIAREETGRE